MKLTRIFHFDAAHHLPGYKGLCKNVHGHTWQVTYTVEGERDNKTGMIIDFGILHEIEAIILGGLDHTDLNKLLPNPTAENIAEWIFVHLENLLFPKINLVEVQVWESSSSCAVYTLDDYYKEYPHDLKSK